MLNAWTKLGNIENTSKVVSSTRTVRNLRKKFGKKEVPLSQFVDQFVKRGREIGSLLNKASGSNSYPAGSAEKIAAVAQSVLEHPLTSTRHRSQELNIPRTSLKGFLHKDLGMKAYRVQIIQELKPHDHLIRFQFAQWAEDRMVVDEHFTEKSSFQMKPISTSEAMSISKIIAFGAQKIQTLSLRSRCTHEWQFGADFGTVASLGHFSSKMSKEPTLRWMASATRPCLTNLFPKIEEYDMDDIWFQQDGATRRQMPLIEFYPGDRFFTDLVALRRWMSALLAGLRHGSRISVRWPWLNRPQRRSPTLCLTEYD